MTQHTATPWDNIESNNSRLIHIEGGLENLEAQGAPIATMTGNRETAKANAAHIVKCVNSYRELIMALKFAKDQVIYGDIHNNHDAKRHLIEQIDAALKLAGEA